MPRICRTDGNFDLKLDLSIEMFVPPGCLTRHQASVNKVIADAVEEDAGAGGGFRRPPQCRSAAPVLQQKLIPSKILISNLHAQHFW